MNDQVTYYVIVPGWRGSEPAHWQSHWARYLPQAVRVEQQDWFRPTRQAWVDELDRTVAQIPASGRVVLIAHSLGCITVAHWVQQAERHRLAKVVGALLVAPADVDRPGCPDALRAFAPIPTRALPFPTLLVGSDNDPAAAVERVEALGERWGSEVCILRNAGHINVKSGHGAWPEGYRYLFRLQQRIERNVLRHARLSAVHLTSHPTCAWPALEHSGVAW